MLHPPLFVRLVTFAGGNASGLLFPQTVDNIPVERATPYDLRSALSSAVFMGGRKLAPHPPENVCGTRIILNKSITKWVYFSNYNEKNSSRTKKKYFCSIS